MSNPALVLGMLDCAKGVESKASEFSIRTWQYLSLVLSLSFLSEGDGCMVI